MSGWARLHCDIRNNVKLARCSIAARWCYICFLTLECDGSLENSAENRWIANQIGVSLKKFHALKVELQAANLLTPDGRVVNYKQRQYQDLGAAMRTAKWREKTVTGDVTGDVTGTRPEQNRTEQICSGAGSPTPDGALVKAKKSRSHDPAEDQAVAEIITHLNLVTGRTFQLDGAHPQLRRALRRDGLTADEAERLIDYKAGEWLDNPKMAQYVSPTTLFRTTNLPKYREEMAAGPVQVGRRKPEPEWQAL